MQLLVSHTPDPFELTRPADVFEQVRPNEDCRSMPLPETEFSDVTTWLLAVRDQQDRAAFARLFAHFAPKLKTMLLRAGLRDGRAEDVVQDVMLAVWDKAAQFDPHRADAAGWIYRIARNRHIDLIRRTRATVDDVIDLPDDDTPDAFQIIALEQEARALREAVETLSPDQRGILEQAFFEELPHTRISAMTGLPLGTIKSRIRLGLARIRRELSDLRP